MSAVEASERLVARPRDEKLANTATENVIVVEGLRMRYGATEAVAGIDLRVARGEIFAFLGPNGAGKTTTVEILEGFRERSGGTVSVLGVDPSDGGREWRNRIGAVLQESSAEPGLTVRECLELYAGYYDQPRSIDETIALVGLGAATRHPDLERARLVLVPITLVQPSRGAGLSTLTDQGQIGVLDIITPCRARRVMTGL